MSNNNFIFRISWALNQIAESNESIAKKLDININTVAAYKKGKGNLNAMVLFRLYKEYDFNPIWMIAGDDSPKINHQTFEIETERFLDRIRIEKRIEKPYAKEIDYDLLSSIISKVEDLNGNADFYVTIEKRAEIVSLLYDYYFKLKDAVDDDTVLIHLKLSDQDF